MCMITELEEGAALGLLPAQMVGHLPCTGLAQV